jgi:hypothetical protein
MNGLVCDAPLSRFLFGVRSKGLAFFDAAVQLLEQRPHLVRCPLASCIRYRICDRCTVLFKTERTLEL